VLLAQIVLFAILGDTLTASHIQRGFIVLTLGTLFWVVGILLRAVLRGREGALVFLLGIALFVASFAVEAVVVEGWVAADRAHAYEFISLGVLMVLYSHMLLMAERFSLAVMRAEDSNADADSNFVMTGSGGIVEVQGTAETTPFTEQRFIELLALAKKGIGELVELQKLTVA